MKEIALHTPSINEEITMRKKMSRKINIEKSTTPRYTLIKVSGPMASGKTTMIDAMAKDYEALGYTAHKVFEGDEINEHTITTPPSRTVVFLETINP